MLFKMRAHNRHRRGLHQHDAVAGGAVPALVLAGARLWRAAPVRHALPAVAVFSWLVVFISIRCIPHISIRQYVGGANLVIGFLVLGFS